MSILELHSGAIKELCDHHKVKALYAFGSVLTGNFDKYSDVDLVVDFDPIPVTEYADNYYDLKFSLQDIFERPVDLLEERALKNPYFKEAIDQKEDSFMDTEIKPWLYDILNAINEIDSFLTSIPRDFRAYQNDLRTKRAIEREIEIIGEAVSRILNQDNSIQLSNARKIVDTRNRIIHGYDTVSDDIIWGIVIKHLPVLRTEIEKLLEN